jgi:hypothetical protein
MGSRLLTNWATALPYNGKWQDPTLNQLYQSSLHPIALRQTRLTLFPHLPLDLTSGVFPSSFLPKLCTDFLSLSYTLLASTKRRGRVGTITWFWRGTEFISLRGEYLSWQRVLWFSPSPSEHSCDSAPRRAIGFHRLSNSLFANCHTVRHCITRATDSFVKWTINR